MDSADAPRTSRLARGAITGVAAARIGAARLGQRLRTPSPQAQAEHEAAVGRILFGALGQLRGTALKVSQLLSMHPTLLPEGVRRELARAQHQALPLNRALVGRVFRQAFGQEPEALFAHFEPSAFAAASLGQVHRAQLPGHGLGACRTWGVESENWPQRGQFLPDLQPHSGAMGQKDGEKWIAAANLQPTIPKSDRLLVAVKVQYPGIAATIASDMQLARAALRALAHTDLPLPTDPVMDSVMNEIEATLLREVDYLQEAEQLQWFAEHAALPGVAMARPHLSHTRAQVLTQQYLPGLHLDAWLATEPTQALRDRAGQHLWDWFMHCIFVLGRVHADPHPGNFLFDADGTVGVLDFGCTRELSEGFRVQVARAWSALLRPAADPQRDALVLQAYQALGLAGPDLALATYSAELAPALADMQAWQLEPFTQPVFDFRTKQPPPITPPEHQRVLGRHLAQVPGEMPAFDRMWMGLMHLLTRLGARVHTRAVGIPGTSVERTLP